jgi:hypothetical protein
MARIFTHSEHRAVHYSQDMNFITTTAAAPTSTVCESLAPSGNPGYHESTLKSIRQTPQIGGSLCIFMFRVSKKKIAWPQDWLQDCYELRSNLCKLANLCELAQNTRLDFAFTRHRSERFSLTPQRRRQRHLYCWQTHKILDPRRLYLWENI